MEISDSELIELYKTQVLPVFSQYCGIKKWCYVDNQNLISDNLPGQPLYRYKIPVKKDELINEILEVIVGQQSILVQEYGMIPFNTMGAIDQVIANSYADAIRSIQTRQTWDFIKPDILELDMNIEDSSTTADTFMVVNYTTNIENLEEMESDHYQLCFKKMCAAQTMLWLSSMRSKYSQISTPFGAIEINWQDLRAEGQQKMEECNQYLASLPPHKLIEVF